VEIVPQDFNYFSSKIYPSGDSKEMLMYNCASIFCLEYKKAFLNSAIQILLSTIIGIQNSYAANF